MKKVVIILLMICAFFPNIKAQPPYRIHTTPNTVTLTMNKFGNIVGYDRSKFSNGLLFAREGKNWEYFLINEKGEIVASGLELRGSFSGFVPTFYDEVATYTKPDGESGLIDRKGVMTPIPKCGKISEKFIDGMTTVLIRIPVTNYKSRLIFQYVDKKGSLIYPNLKQELVNGGDLVDPRPFCDGLSRYYDYAHRKYGYFDKSGKVIIPAKFDRAEDFSEGLALVGTGEGRETMWGFIDVSGKYVIEPKFHKKPESFHDGYSVATKSNGKDVYIDKSGKICSKEFETALRFFKGYALCQEQIGGHTYLINTDLKPVKEMPGGLTIATEEYSELFYYEKQGLFLHNLALYTYDGKLLFDYNQTKITDDSGNAWLFKFPGKFDEDYALIMLYDLNNNEKWGFINANGEIVLLIEDPQF